MGTPLRKATAQKRAPRTFPHGKQTGPGSASRRGIGGGLRAGRAAAVWRATLPVLWRIGQDAMRSACHCPPLASRPETQRARYGFTDRAVVSLRSTLPVLRRTGRDAGGTFPHGKQTGPGSASRRGIGGGLCAAVQLLSGALPFPYFSITVERTGRGGRTVRVRARLHKRP